MEKVENSELEKTELIEIINKMNALWTHGRAGDLRDYFHEGMIIEGPGLVQRVEGRDSCIAHHIEAYNCLDNIQFSTSAHEVSVWQQTAMVKYRFEAQFTSNGEKRREIGQELYAFSLVSGNWKAVWNFIVLSND